MAEGVEPDVLKLHVLARAVIKRADTILLARARGFQHTFLPGDQLEPDESLEASLARELRELGLETLVGTYLGTVEHVWEDAAVTHYEINYLFEASLPTLTSTSGTVPSREAHLAFFWAEVSELSKHQLEPYPLRRLLKDASSAPALWASTLP